MDGYVFGGDTGVSYEELQKRRKIAQGLMQREGMRQPQYALEGLAQGAGAIVGALMDRKAGKKENQMREDFNSEFSDLFGGTFGGGQASPESLPASGGMGQYRDAIASIESAGSGDYQAVGPTNERLGRPLGRYQVMEANLPQWSREALGREVSADEFLANPDIQDAVFDHKFGGYVQEYGPEGAAQAWFAGPGGVGEMDRSDVLGTSVGDYTDKFTSALGGDSSGSGSGAPPNRQRIAQIVKMANSPMATPEQQQVAQVMLQREMQANDPMRQMELERARLELDALRNPPAPDREIIEGADGFNYYEDTGERVLPGIEPSGPATRPMTPEERQQWGIPDDGTPWAMTPGGPEQLSSGPLVENNVGEQESAFDRETGKLLAGEAAEVVNQGAAAQRSLAQLETLENALQNSPSGIQGALTNMASNLGIKTDGASSVEVANAVISQLVPQQRPPGSGVMSDADLELFKQSLPRLINTREGNQQIIETTRAIAEYDIQRGQIARELQLGRISPNEAAQRYQNLGNPLEAFRESNDQGGQGESPRSDADVPDQSDGQSPSAESQTSGSRDFSNMTVEEFGQLDINSLSSAEMDALEKRMEELGL